MSELEETLDFQLRQSGLVGFVREYRFCPPRRFRFDFCFLDKKLAIEVQGGIYIRGGHNRPKVFTSDCEKLNLAVLNGFRLLKFTSDMIHSGDAIKMIRRVYGIDLPHD